MDPAKFGAHLNANAFDTRRSCQSCFSFGEYPASRLGKADHVLDKFEEAINSLSEFPERGVYPQEFLSLGIRDYREIFFKPYRIIYRVIGKRFYIYLIVDGRRDMQTLLNRRLSET